MSAGSARGRRTRTFVVKYNGFVHLGSPLSCKTVPFFIFDVFRMVLDDSRLLGFLELPGCTGWLWVPLGCLLGAFLVPQKAVWGLALGLC